MDVLKEVDQLADRYLDGQAGTDEGANTLRQIFALIDRELEADTKRILKTRETLEEGIRLCDQVSVIDQLI